MKPWISKSLHLTAALVLTGVLAWSIWQPVFPSGWLIQKMAASVNPHALHLETPVVIRFVLGGKGGGTYHLIADAETVRVTSGAETPDRMDLVIFMEAREFNALIFSLAQGKADANTFTGLILSNVLRFAGDMQVLQKLFEHKGGP